MSEYYKPDQTVFIDMDGVVADFDDEVIRRMKLQSPDFRGDLPRTHFYIADDYPEYKAVIRAICAEEGFFKAFPVINGALEGWQRVVDLGYKPRILSAPLHSNKTSEDEKRMWLEEHFDLVFGERVSRDAIIDKAKYKYSGFALIDDRPIVNGAEKASWSHVLMSYPHNEHIDTELRLRDWFDEELEAVLGEAREKYLRRLGSIAF